MRFDAAIHVPPGVALASGDDEPGTAQGVEPRNRLREVSANPQREALQQPFVQP